MSTDIAIREASAFQQIEQAAGLPSNSVSLVGLRLTNPDMTYDEWLSVGRSIGHAHRWTSWALGDWINFGEALFGEMAAQAVESTTGERYDVAQRVTGLAPGTLQNYASICGRVALSRRRVELPFSTHEAVASLEPDEQTRWLQQAVDNGWTKGDVRAAIKESKNPASGDADTDEDEPRLSVSEQIEAAARNVHATASQNRDGNWVVPKQAMAQLTAALGEEQ